MPTWSNDIRRWKLLLSKIFTGFYLKRDIWSYSNLSFIKYTSLIGICDHKIFKVIGQPNVKLIKKKTWPWKGLNDWGIYNRYYWYLSCACSVIAQCLIPNLIVLANRNCYRSLGSSAAPPPWSNLYTYTRTELDENHIITASWCRLCKHSCCRDPVSRLLPVLSHCPVLRNIFVVKILSYFVPASLSIVLLKVASGRQSSGGVVVRLFYLPYMIKTNLFSSIVEQYYWYLQSENDSSPPLYSKRRWYLYIYCWYLQEWEWL